MSLIESRLYIGGYKQATDKKWLQDHSITDVLNCAYELQDISYPHMHTVTYLGMRRDEREPLHTYLERAYHVLTRILRDASKERNVLVHCSSGSSRACAVILYYLMKLRGMSYYTASIHVKKMHEAYNVLQRYRYQLYNLHPTVHYVHV